MFHLTLARGGMISSKPFFVMVPIPALRPRFDFASLPRPRRGVESEAAIVLWHVGRHLGRRLDGDIAGRGEMVTFPPRVR